MDVVTVGAAAPVSRAPSRVAATIALILVGVGGFVLRILPLWAPAGGTDSDEAVVGLMAKHILDGRPPVFYWGQSYGGTPEIAVDAVFRRFFGSSLVVLRLPSLIYGVLAAFLLWKVASALLPRRQAIVATAAFWLSPMLLIDYASREMLFYTPTLVVGLGMLLLAVRFVEHPDVMWRPALFWFLGGLGFWMGANIAYFALPALIYVRAVAAPGAVARRWRGSRCSSWVRPRGGSGTWPTAGARSTTPAPPAGPVCWTTSPSTGTTGCASCSASTTCTRRPRAGRSRPSCWSCCSCRWPSSPSVPCGVPPPVVAPVPLDVIGFVTAPFIYAVLPYRLPIVVVRFFLFAWPFASLLIGRLAVARWATALVGAALALSLFVNVRFYVDAPERVPDLTAARQALEAAGRTTFYGDYWSAYQLTFESDERVVGSPFYSARWPAYDAAARAPHRRAPTSS